MSNSEEQEVSPNELPIPEIPKCLQVRTVTKGLISYADSLELTEYRRAAHACIWAPLPRSSNFGELRAAVMMHLRFDGTFGFPGGLVDILEDVLEGLNREMTEEIGWDPTVRPVKWSDYYSTQVEPGKKLILHFFIVELTIEQFKDLERKCLLASEYGEEVFGTIRVPLYTMDNNYNGFPAFLNNKFVGTAKQQLLLALHHKKIMTESEISEVLYKSQNLKLAPNRF